MKKTHLCICGSGKARKKCCGESPQIKITAHSFAGPEEHQEFLMNLQISSQFQMRYRGLLEYYGKDFIAYKRKIPLNSDTNEFLRVFSSYLTDYLEDNCPSSWKECTPSFWKKFLLYFYPHQMNISPHNKEVEKMLKQLKMFVKWLDKRSSTAWFNVIEEYINEYKRPLKNCEYLLNHLFLIDYPQIHEANWNYEEDIIKLTQKQSRYIDIQENLFQVSSIIEDIVLLVNIKTNQTYYVQGLPVNVIVPDVLMQGAVGKAMGDKFWNWCATEGIYPQDAKSYITGVNRAAIRL